MNSLIMNSGNQWEVISLNPLISFPNAGLLFLSLPLSLSLSLSLQLTATQKPGEGIGCIKPLAWPLVQILAVGLPESARDAYVPQSSYHTCSHPSVNFGCHECMHRP